MGACACCAPPPPPPWIRHCNSDLIQPASHMNNIKPVTVHFPEYLANKNLLNKKISILY